MCVNAILCGLIWAFLRRWYGGLFSDDKYPILSNRGLQSIVMILFTIPLLMLPQFTLSQSLLIAFVLSLWVQFQHWSRAVGCILDAGRNHLQNESNYTRWYRIVLDKIYDCVNQGLEYIGSTKRIEKYRGMYDFWYIAMRFGFPLMVLVPISVGYPIIGFLAAPSYYISWRLFETWPQLYYKLPEYVGQPKNLAEILYGFIFGFGFTILLILRYGGYNGLW